VTTNKTNAKAEKLLRHAADSGICEEEREAFLQKARDLIDGYEKDDDDVPEVFEGLPDPVLYPRSFNDVANGKRLVEYHGENIRFCRALENENGWLIWDGSRWKPDELGAVIEVAKDTADRIHQEATAVQDEANKLIRRGVETDDARLLDIGLWWASIADRAEAWARSSHSGSHIREMVKLSQWM
jgi:hypothetical protein